MITANKSLMALVGFSGLTFHLGAFETPSVAELWARLESSPTAAPGGGGLVFENIVGRRVIHRVTAWPRCAVVKSLSANQRPELEVLDVGQHGPLLLRGPRQRKVAAPRRPERRCGLPGSRVRAVQSFLDGPVQSLWRITSKYMGSDTHPTPAVRPLSQAASQFNCLEMISPGERPEDGVTSYAKDHTQVGRGADTSAISSLVCHC